MTDSTLVREFGGDSDLRNSCVVVAEGRDARTSKLLSMLSRIDQCVKHKNLCAKVKNKG